MKLNIDDRIRLDTLGEYVTGKASIIEDFPSKLSRQDLKDISRLWAEKVITKLHKKFFPNQTKKQKLELETAIKIMKINHE